MENLLKSSHGLWEINDDLLIESLRNEYIWELSGIFGIDDKSIIKPSELYNNINEAGKHNLSVITSIIISLEGIIDENLHNISPWSTRNYFNHNYSYIKTI